MQLFKAFLKIAWKHLPSISIYFVIYAILTFFMGVANGANVDEQFQSKELNICIIDEDNSTASAGLSTYLDSMHKIGNLENDPELLQDYLYYRYVAYILTIPDGFEEKLASGETQDLLTNVIVPGSASGHFVNQQINQYLQTIQLYMAGGYSLEDAISETHLALSKATSVQSLTFNDGVVEEKAVFFFYRYLPYIFIALLICGLAPILITFNQKEISARTTCSSTGQTSRILQLTLGSILYDLFMWGGLLVICLVAYGPEQFFSTNALYAMLNSFAFLLVTAAITLLISLFPLNLSTVNMISNIIGLGMSFLCGVFVDQFLLPESVLKVARFLPAYWYTRANNMLGGLDTEAFNSSFYWMAIGIQVLFAVAIFAVALATSKMRRQKAMA